MAGDAVRLVVAIERAAIKGLRLSRGLFGEGWRSLRSAHMLYRVEDRQALAVLLPMSGVWQVESLIELR